MCVPFCCLLEGIAQVQHLCVCPGARDDLQADRQTVFCEAAGQGQGGQTCEVEWSSEARQSSCLLDRVMTCEGRRGNGGSRSDQKVILLEKLFEPLPDLGLRAPGEDIFR